MQVSAAFDKRSIARTLKSMDEFTRLTGQSFSYATKIMAKIFANELAINSRPLGTSAKVARNFKSSIAVQIFKGAMRNTYNTVAESHEKSRDTKGRVPGELYLVKQHTKFDPKKEKAYIRSRQDSVGSLKAAWLVAYANIKQVGFFPFQFKKPSDPPAKTSKVRWINKHLSKTGMGSGKYSASNGKYSISLTNKLPGATKQNVLVDSAEERANKKSISYYRAVIRGLKKTI